MKIMHLNVYFMPPDDFDGDINDAIDQMIAYRILKSAKKLDKGTTTPPDATQDYIWSTFLADLCLNRKLSGVGYLGEAADWPPKENL